MDPIKENTDEEKLNKNEIAKLIFNMNGKYNEDICSFLQKLSELKLYPNLQKKLGYKKKTTFEENIILICTIVSYSTLNIINLSDYYEMKEYGCLYENAKKIDRTLTNVLNKDDTIISSPKFCKLYEVINDLLPILSKRYMYCYRSFYAKFFVGMNMLSIITMKLYSPKSSIGLLWYLLPCGIIYLLGNDTIFNMNSDMSDDLSKLEDLRNDSKIILENYNIIPNNNF